MIINRIDLLNECPIVVMANHKVKQHGVSWGLGEAGYDIRLKQSISFIPNSNGGIIYMDGEPQSGRFVIASAMEEFRMPETLVGIVHDKSTWARQGVSVFNTVIEPGWNGFLTLEIVFHGNKDIHLEAGSGIAQVIFHRTSSRAKYEGKYQDQPNAAVPAILT